MELISIILIGITLALDCLAICVCVSSLQKIKKTELINIPLHFAIFQAGMLVLGYYLGKYFESYIKSYAPWIAFILLAGIGIKIIYDSLKENTEEVTLNSEKTLIILSIATSIDALVIGITFSLIEVSLILSSVIIAIVTFIISLLGLLIGKKIAEFKFNFAGIAGGLVLIFLGSKTLVMHLFF